MPDSTENGVFADLAVLEIERLSVDPDPSPPKSWVDPFLRQEV